MNINQFKAMLLQNGETMGDLAKRLGIGRNTLSNKINGHSDFSLKEVNIIQDAYNLSLEEMKSIFFS